MKFSARRASSVQPGVTGTARVGRTAELLARLQPGDIAFVDHVDLDRDTAGVLADAGVQAVVNASPMVSGREADPGLEVLSRTGVVMVDNIGRDALAAVRDGAPVRVHGAVVYAVSPDGAGEVLAQGRALGAEQVRAEAALARNGLVSQVDALNRSTGDFLRREQALVLEGAGLPEITTEITGRPVLVVGRTEHRDVKALRRLVRDQAPVVIAVGSAADDLLGVGWVPAIVVVAVGEHGSLPSTDALRVAQDVVVVRGASAGREELRAIELAGVTPRHVESTATGEDVALLLADHGNASLVVGVGLKGRLEDALKDPSHDRVSSYVTRLKLGSRLIDAEAVRQLYGSRGRSMQTTLVTLAGIAALLAAISVTPVGHDWAEDLVSYVQDLV